MQRFMLASLVSHQRKGDVVKIGVADHVVTLFIEVYTSRIAAVL